MFLAPSEICFSQDSINNVFDKKCLHRYKPIGTTLDEICDGRCRVNDIPTISVMERNGKWVTADNRRLWVFKKLEALGKVDQIYVTKTSYIPSNKLTSLNGGASVYVRGDPGGRWHIKASTRQGSRPLVSSVPLSYQTTKKDSTTQQRSTVSTSAFGTASIDTVGNMLHRQQLQRSSGVTLTTNTFPDHSRPSTASRGFVLSDRNQGRNQTTTHLKSDKYLVCAIDFGTTYSGWVYSFKDDFQKDPTKAYIRQWLSDNGKLCTEKTPTVVLVNSDGKTLAAFGYEAENKYKQLAESDQHHGFYLFRRFKMSLYKRLGEGITRDILLKDEFGRKLPAIDVFAMSIKYLADDLKENLNAKQLGFVGEGEINWVLTIPAIWTDAAKQFMREAAIKAGISPERLTLALEPEAASLYCRHLKPDLTEGSEAVTPPPPGSRYLTFDAGGGTVDITLHKFGPADTLCEMKPACGADSGGILVDKAFEKLMKDIVGEQVYEDFKATNADDYMEFLRDFENVKRQAGLPSVNMISIRIPVALMDEYFKTRHCQLKDALACSTYSGYISLVRDKLRIESKFFASLFEEAVSKSVDEVKKILQDEDLDTIHAIYMVGGFSQSPLLQKGMRKAFPSLNIVVPLDAATCVLKGALIHGHNPLTISERVLKYTYGVQCTTNFDHDVHPNSKMKIIDGVPKCTDIFSTHVRKGQAVRIGQKQTRRRYTACLKNQSAMSFPLFASVNVYPRFTDEDGCRKVGEAEIKLDDPYAMTYPEVDVSLTFSETEIILHAEEVATGNKIKADLNFLG